MANSVLVQLLNDGPRNAILKVTGILDSSDITQQVIVDPSLLSSMQPAFSGYPKPDRVSIKSIDYNIQDTTEVRLYWDATSPVLIENLAGRSATHYSHFGDLQTNAGAGVTGKITISTVSASAPSASVPVHFTLVIWCIKHNYREDSQYGPSVDIGSLDFSSSAGSGLLPVIL